jgi:hypothetical protein
MKSSTVELAYIGSVVPDEPKFHNEAFSRAGNMFQTNLLAGLKADGMEPSVVLTCRPVPAYPRSRIVVARASRAALSCGTPITLLPILNITPIKQILLQCAWRDGSADVDVAFRLLFAQASAAPFRRPRSREQRDY